jgi:hypothetical protein
MTYILRVIVAALSWILIGNLSAADTIRINVRHSDETVRQRLLELTPLGTPTEQVFRVARSRLHREGPVVGWPPKYPRKRFGNFFSAWLGHYYEAKYPFIFPTVVQAFWYFDDRDKLRDIRVRRAVSGL